MQGSLAISGQRQSLVVGHRLRCPRCGNVADFLEYFVFDRPEQYADELNVVVKCRAYVRRPGGRLDTCRTVFSPGEMSPEVVDG